MEGLLQDLRYSVRQFRRTPLYAGAVISTIALATAMLFDVQPLDPGVFAAVAALMSTVAVLATLIPARRASRVDPLVALRAE